jgi:hypothetical protein
LAKLTAKARAKLPASTFGLPGKRAFPIPDKSHAANAKARSTQAVKAGRMSSSTKAKIDAKANRVLGHSSASPDHKKMTLKDVIGQYQRARKS